MCRLAREKRIVLTQITDLQIGMANDFTAVEFFFTEQDSQQRTFSSPVPSDESDLHIVRNRRVRSIQQYLLTITLVSIPNLHQHSHQPQPLLKKSTWKAAVYRIRAKFADWMSPLCTHAVNLRCRHLKV